ncbi:MAG: protein translocase subunit SecF [Candidatus Eisenbacteria bacterium]|uniref:Protein-export membrane protein SecF n=1 Tax=Eiseniibacteriota bacterium TaxID=2212470 RepID=A0A937X936_UNCEI|nr:protein translocase subunit SecF [Candidatus Eisenbacteria bacterium]
MLTILQNTRFDFMGKRRPFYFVSAAIILAGIVSIIAHGGLRLGIDFAGGRLIEYRLSQELPIGELRDAVSRAGFAQAELQRVRGTAQFLVRIPGGAEAETRGGEATPSTLIRRALEQGRPGLTAELLREESIGAKVGKEIRSQAFWAILIAMGLILIYIGLRFEFWFGVGGVLALAHDVLITLGILSLLNREITMTVVAALLTIVGFSINDTIVVYDRVREQMVKLRRESFESVLNISVNQTLSRTVITSFTVLLTSVMLLLLGGEVIRDFALAMTVGVLTGTYSSIFIASAAVLDLRRKGQAKAAA